METAKRHLSHLLLNNFTVVMLNQDPYHSRLYVTLLPCCMLFLLTLQALLINVAVDVVSQSFLDVLPALATDPALPTVPALSLVPVLPVMPPVALLAIVVLPAIGCGDYIRSFQPEQTS
jgi:hypothetical protein